MSAELDSLKQRIAELPVAEKAQLATFITEQLEQADLPPALSGDQDKNESVRSERMEWLKAHRAEYGGQYVALDGVALIGVGRNYREAREKALAARKRDAFVTYLPKPDEVAEWGGWG